MTSILRWHIIMALAVCVSSFSIGEPYAQSFTLSTVKNQKGKKIALCEVRIVQTLLSKPGEKEKKKKDTLFLRLHENTEKQAMLILWDQVAGETVYYEPLPAGMFTVNLRPSLPAGRYAIFYNLDISKKDIRGASLLTTFSMDKKGVPSNVQVNPLSRLSSALQGDLKKIGHLTEPRIKTLMKMKPGTTDSQKPLKAVIKPSGETDKVDPSIAAYIAKLKTMAPSDFIVVEGASTLHEMAYRKFEQYREDLSNENQRLKILGKMRVLKNWTSRVDTKTGAIIITPLDPAVKIKTIELRKNKTIYMLLDNGWKLNYFPKRKITQVSVISQPIINMPSHSTSGPVIFIDQNGNIIYREYDRAAPPIQIGHPDRLKVSHTPRAPKKQPFTITPFYPSVGALKGARDQALKRLRQAWDNRRSELNRLYGKGKLTWDEYIQRVNEEKYAYELKDQRLKADFQFKIFEKKAEQMPDRDPKEFKKWAFGLQEKRLKDGSFVQRFDDGSRVTYKPDGTIIRISPKGDKTTRNNPGSPVEVITRNGDKIIYRADGTIIQHTRKGDIILDFHGIFSFHRDIRGKIKFQIRLVQDYTEVFSIHPSSDVIFHYIKDPKGKRRRSKKYKGVFDTGPRREDIKNIRIHRSTVIVDYKDGRKIVFRHDGAQVKLFPNGLMVIAMPYGKLFFSDGKKNVTKADGTKVVLQRRWDGKSYRDFKITEVKPDGTKIEYGSVRRRGRLTQRKRAVYFPDGRVTRYDRDTGTLSGEYIPGKYFIAYDSDGVELRLPSRFRIFLTPDLKLKKVEDHSSDIYRPSVLPNGQMTMIHHDGKIIPLPENPKTREYVLSKAKIKRLKGDVISITLKDGYIITTDKSGRDFKLTSPDGTTTTFFKNRQGRVRERRPYKPIIVAPKGFKERLLEERFHEGIDPKPKAVEIKTTRIPSRPNGATSRGYLLFGGGTTDHVNSWSVGGPIIMEPAFFFGALDQKKKTFDTICPDLGIPIQDDPCVNPPQKK